jgi:TolB-like protein
LGQTLDLITAKVGENRGHVIHYAGDAVLAEFPSAIGAFECATSIQDELRRRNESLPGDKKFQIRIGINLGDVIVDRDDIYGDGVNVAARLESLATPGGICVSDSVYGQVHKRSGFDFEDLGAQRVKNIADPVRAYRVLFEGEKTRTKMAEIFDFWRGKLSGIGIGAGILVTLFGLFWIATEPADTGMPELAIELAPTVAVLPFRTIGIDRQNTGFGAGLTQDVITELAAKTEFRVVATKGAEGEDARQIGRSLKSRYVLDGSVRFGGELLRVSAQLVDAQTGVNLWAGRYDRPAGDVLAVQVDVAKNIVGTLAQQLTNVDTATAAPSEEPASMESRLMRGLELVGRVVELVVMMPQDMLDFGAGNPGR